MKILVINPPRVDGYPVVREERYEHKDMGAVYPPLNLLYVTSVLRKDGFDVSIIDANGFNLSYNDIINIADEIKPKIIISRIGFDTQYDDISFLKSMKERYKSILIVRNKIISDVDWLREKFLLENNFIDIFLNVEPDAVISKVVSHIINQGVNNLKELKGISFIENGKVITTEPAEVIKNLDEIPFPAYDLLPNLKPYHTGVLDSPFATVVTSRGCPFQCTFCAYANMGHRFRSAENVVEELRWLKKDMNLKSFLFFDDLIGLKRDVFLDILKLMIKEKLNLRWVSCTRANLITDEMLKLMKKAGCEEMALGIESGSEKVLNATHKNIKLDDIRKAAKLLHKNKILFYGLAIIGLPGETRETVKETLKFIKEIDPFYTQFTFATPFPNTEIYKYYKENNLLLTEDWSKYSPLSLEPVIRTKELSPEELKELRAYLYRKLILRPIYLLKKIRLFDWKWNIEGFIKILGRLKALLLKKLIR